MKTVDLSTQTPAQLAELFCVLAIAKGKANLERRISRYNQLYHKLEAVEKELQARNGNECRQLAKFYNHPDPQVRLDAALTTLGIFPHAGKSRAAKYRRPSRISAGRECAACLERSGNRSAFSNVIEMPISVLDRLTPHHVGAQSGWAPDLPRVTPQSGAWRSVRGLRQAWWRPLLVSSEANG